MTLYDELQVTEEATTDEIRKAYRKMAMRHHPDRGGEREQFDKIQLAYEVLTDEARRADYDKTGNTGTPSNQRVALLQHIARLMMAVIDQIDPTTANLIEVMKQELIKKREDFTASITNIVRALNRRRYALERLSHKDGVQREDVMTQMLKSSIAELEELVKRNQDAIALHDQMLEILDDYSYTTDPAVPWTTFGTFSATGTFFSRP